MNHNCKVCVGDVHVLDVDDTKGCEGCGRQISWDEDYCSDDCVERAEGELAMLMEMTFESKMP